MLIGYVKLKKFDKEIIKKRPIKGRIIYIRYIISKAINTAKQDKENKDIFYVVNNNNKTKMKLNNILAKNGYKYVVYEKGIDTGYPKVKSKLITKYLLPEIVEYCKEKLKFSIDEIYLCMNEYKRENEDIIKELVKNTKVVNIVSNNPLYKKLENKLEENDVYITVINNRRKSLKNADIVINFDFKNFKEFNINRNMVLINLCDESKISNGFEGIIITEGKIVTKRVKRIFSEFENFNNEELLIVEMIKNDSYLKNRKFIKENKIELKRVNNKQQINNSEFDRISEIYNMNKAEIK